MTNVGSINKPLLKFYTRLILLLTFAPLSVAFGSSYSLSTDVYKLEGTGEYCDVYTKTKNTSKFDRVLKIPLPNIKFYDAKGNLLASHQFRSFDELVRNQVLEHKLSYINLSCDTIQKSKIKIEANGGFCFIDGEAIRKCPLIFEVRNSVVDRLTPDALYNLGILYDNGQGVKQDYSSAAKWYTKAAEQGHASAQYNLGVLYDNGQGVKQDYSSAAKWYTKAAEQGDASAQAWLGVLYANGQGVKQDYSSAAKWYTKAAEQGDASAQAWLGVLYDNGQGVKQDYSSAAKWYTKAAEQGDASAQAWLDAMAEEARLSQAHKEKPVASNSRPGYGPGRIWLESLSLFKSAFQKDYIRLCLADAKFSEKRCECFAEKLDASFTEKEKHLILNPLDNPFALIEMLAPMLDIHNQCRSERR